MSLQSQIQQIIESRKIRAEKIQIEIDNINKLTSKLEYIKKKIQELGIDNSSENIQKIQTKIKELDKAKMQALHLRERFDKKSVNIGVSGFTHAGKSTLLQAISGLTDEEIPKANVNDAKYLHATTAICSQIFNSPREYAEIVFKTEDEFIESVNVYTEKLLINPISSKSEIEEIQIPEREDGEPEKNTAIARLTEIKEAYQYYSNRIDYKPTVKTLTRDEFSTLSNYVACQASCKEKRFYPAVKEVRIYCKFPSFTGENENTEICLVDLPGFGNFDDDVQTKGLKEKVDHIIFIYKTDKAQAIDNDQYVKCQRTIIDINDFKVNKLDFESFIINEDKTIDIWKKLTDETLESIKSRYGNYKTFNFSAYDESKKSREVLNEILNTLTTSLPKMDDELISAYMKNRDLSETLGVLTEISLCLERMSARNSATPDIAKKARVFRKELNSKLRKLLVKYHDKDAEKIDSRFENELEKIKDEIDADIEKDLLYEPVDNYDTWEDFVENAAVGDITGNVPLELKRLWISIIKRYVKLDVIYKESMDNLKKEILRIFVELTNDLIENKEADNFDEILDKLKNRPENQIYQAFLSINNLKQDFRQNIYPFIFKIGDNRFLQKKGITQEDGTNMGVFDLNEEGLVTSYLKEQLICQAKFANDQIKSTIFDHYILRYFLIGVLDTFINYIIYTNIENHDDFVEFCDDHKAKMYPTEYGDQADVYKYDEFKGYVNEVINLVKSF